METPRHPEAEKLGWRLLEHRAAYENAVMLLREWDLQRREGEVSHYAYVEKGTAVAVLPITYSGDVVLLRRYYFPVDRWCYDIPRRTGCDLAELSLRQAVMEQLVDEMGAHCDALEEIGEFYSNPALTDECCHVFLALGANLGHLPLAPVAEEAHLELRQVAEVMELARNGRLHSGPAALTVLLCERRLRELGFL